jgi:ketosteroid isomerase-like protein
MRRLFLALAALLLAPTAHAQDDLARETAQVEDLRSIREIKRLQAYWGHLAIAGDWKAMAGLVTEDARVVLAQGDAVGPAGIEEWLRQRMGGGADGIPAGTLNLRLYISPVITLAPDGQSATGRWHHIAMTAQAGTSADWLGTTDVVQYRKTGEGWRVAHVRPYLHFAGPYDTGWGHDADTLERAPYHYTPDEAGAVLPERDASQSRPAEDLAREATLLLAQSEAQNVVDAYGYYLDRGMYGDIADLFTPGASIDVAGQGSFRGPEGVRRFLARFGAAGLDEGELNDRPQLMPLVSLAEDGSRALVRTVELGMTGRHGAEGDWSAAIQTFLLLHGEDGKWRISLMHHSPLMRADYEQGWAHPLPATPPLGDGERYDAPSELGSLSYPDHPFALPSLGPMLVLPSPAQAAPIEPVPGALALAEAFDGAENVSNAYGYYIDQFAWRATADLFARDGWKELSYIGTFIGKDRVLGSLIQRYGEGGPNDAFQAIHQKTQPYVTVLGDGTRAHIRTRLMQFNSSSTGPGSWIGGIYENQVVKEDGIWRIHGMDLDYVWLADYATGWTGIDPEASKRFAPTAEQLEAFGPDAPLRGETFAPYPRIAPMGFHFANPVSGREPETRLTWSDGNREEK